MSDERMRERAEAYLSLCTEYTDPYEREKLVRDWENKEEAAKNVVRDFTRRADDPKGKRILDIGFGNGEYSIAFARAGANVHGLEVNPVLLRLAQEHAEEAHVHVDLRVYDGSVFPFEDGFFDYAYSISVLEHTTDPKKILEEAYRTLKPDGKFYLAFPNRLSPKETHTGIWGLNYVSRRIAQFLLRHVWGRNTIEELNLHFLSYWHMKRFAREVGFSIVYELDRTGLRGTLKRLLAYFGMHHSAILRTVMVILVK